MTAIEIKFKWEWKITFEFKVFEAWCTPGPPGRQGHPEGPNDKGPKLWVLLPWVPPSNPTTQETQRDPGSKRKQENEMFGWLAIISPLRPDKSQTKPPRNPAGYPAALPYDLSMIRKLLNLEWLDRGFHPNATCKKTWSQIGRRQSTANRTPQRHQIQWQELGHATRKHIEFHICRPFIQTLG